MLHVQIGVSLDYLSSISSAVESYNKLEGNKRFIKSETIFTTYVSEGNTMPTIPNWITSIWYEVSENQVKKEEEKNYFVGSTDIDPQDPNWREKWEAVQRQNITEETSVEEWQVDLDQETADTYETSENYGTIDYPQEGS